MKTIILLLSLTMLCLTGCASWGNVTTTITDPNNQVWMVESRSDALVHVKSGEVEIIVDNRGRMSAFEAILGIVMTNVDFKITNKGDDED